MQYYWIYVGVIFALFFITNTTHHISDAMPKPGFGVPGPTCIYFSQHSVFFCKWSLGLIVMFFYLPNEYYLFSFPFPQTQCPAPASECQDLGLEAVFLRRQLAESLEEAAAMRRQLSQASEEAANATLAKQVGFFLNQKKARFKAWFFLVFIHLKVLLSSHPDQTGGLLWWRKFDKIKNEFMIYMIQVND